MCAVVTMEEIRRKLQKEKLVREDTPSTFISMGLEIEESQ
jgi:hypothetical protein